MLLSFRVYSSLANLYYYLWLRRHLTRLSSPTPSSTPVLASSLRCLLGAVTKRRFLSAAAALAAAAAGGQRGGRLINKQGCHLEVYNEVLPHLRADAARLGTRSM